MTTRKKKEKGVTSSGERGGGGRHVSGRVRVPMTPMEPPGLLFLPGLERGEEEHPPAAEACTLVPGTWVPM